MNSQDARLARHCGRQRPGTGAVAGQTPTLWPWCCIASLLILGAAILWTQRADVGTATAAEQRPTAADADTIAAGHALAALAASSDSTPGRASRIPAFLEALPDWDLQVRSASGQETEIRLCQCSQPCIQGVDCSACPDQCGGEPLWSAQHPIPWQAFAHGEYVGPARTVHMRNYRLRVDDQLEFVYRFTHETSNEPYRMGVGDELAIESLSDETLNRGDLTLARGLVVQPDGTITLRLLGRVSVAGKTIDEIRAEVSKRYEKYYNTPEITVTPLKTNTKLEDLRDAIDSRFGAGGQVRQARVTPEGTVQLPGVGSVPAHGLLLSELEREIEQRYRDAIGPGIEITPVVVQRAPRFVFVVGEVVLPVRYPLEGPTTVMQAIALARGWRNGGNLREVVVFRRTDDWRLMATRLDIRGALIGKRPCPADEVWLRDSDLVVVPKSAILLADDFIELVFTRGIYGIVPFSVSLSNFGSL